MSIFKSITGLCGGKAKMTTKNQTKVGCGVLVFNEENKILFMKRNSKHRCGSYSLVGGWIEFGETFEQAAAREAMEEIGVEIHNIKIIGVTNNFFPEENSHSVSVVMGAKIKSGVPQNKEPHKCEYMLWCDSWNNLPTPLFTSYNQYITQEMIDKYLEN